MFKETGMLTVLKIYTLPRSPSPLTSIIWRSAKRHIRDCGTWKALEIPNHGPLCTLTDFMKTVEFRLSLTPGFHAWENADCKSIRLKHKFSNHINTFLLINTSRWCIVVFWRAYLHEKRPQRTLQRFQEGWKTRLPFHNLLTWNTDASSGYVFR